MKTNTIEVVKNLTEDNKEILFSNEGLQPIVDLIEVYTEDEENSQEIDFKNYRNIFNADIQFALIIKCFCSISVGDDSYSVTKFNTMDEEAKEYLANILRPEATQDENWLASTIAGMESLIEDFKSEVQQAPEYDLYKSHIVELDSLPAYMSNGEENHLRTILKMILLTPANIRLVGEASTGKNLLINYVSAILGIPLLEDSGSDSLDEFSLGGYEKLIDGQLEYVPSKLAIAMKNGFLYNADELNAMRAEKLTILHSVLDDRRCLHPEGQSFKIEAAPTFRFISTMNYDYEGTNSLNEALETRFNTLFIRNKVDLKQLLESQKNYNKGDDSFINTLVEIYQHVCDSIANEGSIPSHCNAIRCYKAAYNTYVSYRQAGLLDAYEEVNILKSTITAISPEIEVIDAIEELIHGKFQ